jgi:hypothetical protein
MRSDFVVMSVGMAMMRLVPEDHLAGGVQRKVRKEIAVAGVGALQEGALVVFGGTPDAAVPEMLIRRSFIGTEVLARCSCGLPTWTTKTCGHALALRDLLLARIQPGHPPLPDILERHLCNEPLGDLVGTGLLGHGRDEEYQEVVRAISERHLAAARQALTDVIGAESGPHGNQEPQRLVWRVTPTAIEAVLQKRNIKGGWTGGRLLRPDSGVVWNESDIGAADDLPVLGLWTRNLLNNPDRLRREHWDVVTAHPRLIDDAGHAVAVRHGSMHTALTPTPDGFRLAVTGLPEKVAATWHGPDVTVAFTASPPTLTIYAVPAGAARLRLEAVRVPAELLHDELFSKAVIATAADLDPSLAGDPEPASPQVHLRISCADDSGDAVLAVRPSPESHWLMPGEGAVRVPVRDPSGAKPWRVLTRDLDAESAAAADLQQRLALPPGRQWQLDLAGLADLVGRAAAAGVEPEWTSRRLGVGTLGSGALRVRIGKGRAWFDIEGSLTTDVGTMSLAQALDAARANRGWVRLGSDRLVRLEDDLRRRLELLEAAQGPANDFASPLVDAAVDGLADAQVDADKAFLDLRRRLAQARSCDPTVPGGLQANLRDYQVQGFAWMARLSTWGAGAVLADDMGLGKTLQAIAMLLHRRAAGPALVVCPTSVEANWMDEIIRFAPGLVPRLARDGMDDVRIGEVLIISFGLVQRRGALLAGVAWGTLVVDEAHLAKNADAKRSRALAQIRADWRLCLTGTPVENRLDELWAVLGLAVPGLLGDRHAFHEVFSGPVAAGDPVAGGRLRRRIAPFLLRRTKEEVLRELPPLTESVRAVELSKDERAVYRAEEAR